MKKIKLFPVFFSLCFLSGCITAQESVKGLLGVSTQVLEDNRKDALKKECSGDLISCHNKIKAILKENNAYIYADDLSNDMLALYVSQEDTTPVGVFLTELSNDKTGIEVCSPSTYGKETIAKILFSELDKSSTSKEKGQVNAGQAQAVSQ